MLTTRTKQKFSLTTSHLSLRWENFSLLHLTQKIEKKEKEKEKKNLTSSQPSMREFFFTSPYPSLSQFSLTPPCLNHHSQCCSSPHLTFREVRVRRPRPHVPSWARPPLVLTAIRSGVPHNGKMYSYLHVGDSCKEVLTRDEQTHCTARVFSSHVLQAALEVLWWEYLDYT